MRKIILLVFVAIASLTVYAQEKTIFGIVTDETGPLPGVNIQIKGTTIGTETDFDGKYSIKANTSDILVFSFVGMVTQKKTVGKSNIINVVLTTSSATLDEVVVTAYGIRRNRKVLGYSTRRQQRKQQSNTSPSMVLQGRAAGVNITTTNGVPSSNSNIIIRGYSSINGNNQPLYIIDGVSFDGNSKKLQKLNPNKIKDIKVLKGANATSLYGSKGANGVIVINTKNGNYQNEAYEKIKENQIEITSVWKDLTYHLVKALVLHLKLSKKDSFLIFYFHEVFG